MIQRIFLAIAGQTVRHQDTSVLYSDCQLDNAGISETVRLGFDAKKTGYIPTVIFTDGAPSAVQSAHLMAGVVGTQRIVNDTRLAKATEGRTYLNRHKHDPFRAHFNTCELAHAFLNKVYPLGEDDDTVLFMTAQAWGRTFGESWPQSTLRLFYLSTQELQFIAYHGPRA